MSVGVVNKNTGDRIPTAGMPAIDNALDLTSSNPVQNAVITAALANKQDKTDNALQTTDKTVVGAINEHEGDISSLMSGLTNLIIYRQQNVTIGNIPANGSSTTGFQPVSAPSGYKWIAMTPLTKNEGYVITVGWINNAFRIVAYNLTSTAITDVDVEINWVYIKES